MPSVQKLLPLVLLAVGGIAQPIAPRSDNGLANVIQYSKREGGYGDDYREHDRERAKEFEHKHKKEAHEHKDIFKFDEEFDREHAKEYERKHADHHGGHGHGGYGHFYKRDGYGGERDFAEERKHEHDHEHKHKHEFKAHENKEFKEFDEERKHEHDKEHERKHDDHYGGHSYGGYGKYYKRDGGYGGEEDFAKERKHEHDREHKHKHAFEEHRDHAIKEFDEERKHEHDHEREHKHDDQHGGHGYGGYGRHYRRGDGYGDDYREHDREHAKEFQRKHKKEAHEHKDIFKFDEEFDRDHAKEYERKHGDHYGGYYRRDFDDHEEEFKEKKEQDNEFKQKKEEKKECEEKKEVEFAKAEKKFQEKKGEKHDGFGYDHGDEKEKKEKKVEEKKEAFKFKQQSKKKEEKKEDKHKHEHKEEHKVEHHKRQIGLGVDDLLPFIDPQRAQSGSRSSPQVNVGPETRSSPVITGQRSTPNPENDAAFMPNTLGPDPWGVSNKGSGGQGGPGGNGNIGGAGSQFGRGGGGGTGGQGGSGGSGFYFKDAGDDESRNGKAVGERDDRDNTRRRRTGRVNTDDEGRVGAPVSSGRFDRDEDRPAERREDDFGNNDRYKKERKNNGYYDY